MLREKPGAILLTLVGFTASLASRLAGYRIVGIYYKSFNFVNFANQKALAKIKVSIYFWIHIV